MAATESDADVNKCLARALRFLAHRDFSRSEMTRKLTLGHYPHRIIEETIGRLERLKYIDDIRLAGQIARVSAHQQSYALRRARAEMSRRGVGREVAEAALREVYSHVDSTALAQRLAQKYTARLKKLDPQVARRRLAGLLFRRGFDLDAVHAVVEKSFENLEDCMAEASNDQELMQAFIRARQAHCPVCGNDLRDMNGSQCPACNAPLTLELVSPRPSAGIWIAATILLFANAGIGILFGLALIGSMMQKEALPPSAAYRFIWLYLACIPVAIVFLFLRRPFVRLGFGSQLVSLLVVCAVTIGGFVWIFLSK